MFSINGLSVNTFSVDGFGEAGREAGLSGAIQRERLMQQLYQTHAEGGIGQANFKTSTKRSVKKNTVSKDQLLQQYLKRVHDREAEENEDLREDQPEEKFEERIIGIEVTYDGVSHRIDAAINNRADDMVLQVLNINTKIIDVEPNITVTTLRTSWK